MTTTTTSPRRVAALAPLAGLLALAGCRDVLDVQPKTFYGTTNFYETPAQVDQAVLGLYARLQTVYGSALGNNGPLWALTELRSDNTTYQFNPSDRSNLATEQLDEFLVTPDNAAVNGIWATSYTPILEANTILDRAEAVSYADAAQRDRHVGEARFNRALHYFNLVRLFGDVPLFTRPVTSYAASLTPQRAPAESVYRVIVADAQDAIAKLPARAAA
jgi:starch-binding outer membrane protein, SusD/RagB family